jgi:hypothetical protein
MDAILSLKSVAIVHRWGLRDSGFSLCFQSTCYHSDLRRPRLQHAQIRVDISVELRLKHREAATDFLVFLRS